jgi:hypothetical protein
MSYAKLQSLLLEHYTSPYEYTGTGIFKEIN